MRRSTLDAIERAVFWTLMLAGWTMVVGRAIDLALGPPAEPAAIEAAAEPQPAADEVAPQAAPEAARWLNTATGTRHNKSCRHFGRTQQGRPCGPEEGSPCGLCGG